MEHVYASLDIGSDTIKLVVCELFHNHLNLLAATSVPSEGIKKGLITDPALAKKSIEKAFDEIEGMLGVKIKKVIASVPNHLAEYRIIKSEINVETDLVTNKDITNAFKKGISSNLPLNEEFVTIMPIDFLINGKTVVKDPKDYPANKLMARAMMVTVPKKNVYSVASVVESLGIEIADISVGSIGDINCFKTEELTSGLCSVVNIGLETTAVTLCSKGIPIKTKVIGIGSKEIDEDISFTYRVDIEKARKIKETFALAHKRHASANEYYEIENFQGKKVKINQLEVSEMVMTKLSEILSTVKNELNLLTNKPIQYIIVTGGISNMQDIEYCLHENLSMSSIKGKVKLIGVRNNKYSTAIGNIIYFLNTLKLKGLDYSMLSEDDMDNISSPDRHILNASNDTMIGKVFGYFFGE